MQLPFAPEQFFEVFRRYNEAVWPVQWVLVGLAIAAVVLVARGTPQGSRVAVALLALLWLWVGVVYHLGFFSAINPAARVFGALCIVQAGLFAWLGGWRGQLVLGTPSGVRGAVGGALLTYALVVYPLLGFAQGRRYPYAPTFGLPCPTTIFTFGLLLWAVRRVPGVVLIIPVLWSVVATTAAVRLGVWEDLGLPIAAVVTVLLVLPRGRWGAILAGAR